MTRDEIMSLPAGREMDAYIAEKVTGVSTCPWHGNIPADDTPYYSTDIASAWGIVEKFYSMTFNRWSDGKEFRCYLVAGRGRDGKNFDGMAVADTAPLAICRASLLAVLGMDKVIK